MLAMLELKSICHMEFLSIKLLRLSMEAFSEQNGWQEYRIINNLTGI